MSKSNWKDRLRRTAAGRIAPPAFQKPTGSEYRVLDREQFLPVSRPGEALWKFGAAAVAVMVLLTGLGVGVAGLLPASGRAESGEDGGDTTGIWWPTTFEETTTLVNSTGSPSEYHRRHGSPTTGGETFPATSAETTSTGGPQSSETFPEITAPLPGAHRRRKPPRLPNRTCAAGLWTAFTPTRRGGFRIRLPKDWTVYELSRIANKRAEIPL